MVKILEFLKNTAETYDKYKSAVDAAASVGKAYLDYKDAKRRNELEEAAYSDYMAAAEAAGQEAQAAIDLNLTPMTIANLPTKKADVTSFTKATGVKDGGIMRLKDGTPDPNPGITALRKVRPDVVAKMGLAGGGGPGIEALRKKAPDVVKRMGFKEGMNEDMVEEKIYTASYEPGSYSDDEIEAYENYKYDMNEQKPGFPIMEIDDFLRFFYSDAKNTNMKMASAQSGDDGRNDLAQMLFGKTLDLLSEEELEILNEETERLMQKYMASGGIASFAKGGRVKYAQGSGGIMDMGGMEKDYRFTGGFVPIGEYERKDDVPARLSKNEFVFTADAVRAAGGGSIQKGAKRMYDTMKNLEAKPQAKGMMA